MTHLPDLPQSGNFIVRQGIEWELTLSKGVGGREHKLPTPYRVYMLSQPSGSPSLVKLDTSSLRSK